MPGSPVDANKALGMTVVFAHLDIEQAVGELHKLGFAAAEIFVGHLGPREVSAPVLEAHAAATGDFVRSRGLTVSTLNCIVGEFDPFTSPEALERTAAGISAHLRLAAAMGSPRILIWDGELDEAASLTQAPASLARAIEAGCARSGLAEPPAVAVELHPNTFALKHGRHDEVASALASVGAGICLDFCHAAVALGPDFADSLSTSFLEAVSHVHFADSDCVSEQLHFPPGAGKVNLDAAERRLAGRGLAVGWDLFGWPAPRQAAAAGLGRYRAAVQRIGGVASRLDAAGA
jgi:sugar phosphate isomerase/epimerase